MESKILMPLNFFYQINARMKVPGQYDYVALMSKRGQFREVEFWNVCSGVLREHQKRNWKTHESSDWVPQWIKRIQLWLKYQEWNLYLEYFSFSRIPTGQQATLTVSGLGDENSLPCGKKAREKFDFPQVWHWSEVTPHCYSCFFFPIFFG